MLVLMLVEPEFVTNSLVEAAMRTYALYHCASSRRVAAVAAAGGALAVVFMGALMHDKSKRVSSLVYGAVIRNLRVLPPVHT